MGIARPRRTFDREFKLRVVRQLRTGEKRIAQICREHQLSETCVRRWKEQYDRMGEEAWREGQHAHEAASEAQRVSELEAALGRAHLEIELLRRALKAAEKGALVRSGDER